MEPELRTLARRQYELARLKRSIGWGLPALLFSSALFWRGFATSVPIALLASVLAIGLAWRGRQWRHGVAPGLAAGLLAGIVPVYFACGVGCSDTCELYCATSSAVAGVAGGLLLTRVHGWQATAGGLALASLLATSGCLALGAGGWIGVLAVSAVSLPVAAVRPLLFAQNTARR